MKHRILFPAAAMVASILFIARQGADARPDVVSAASLVVAITNITATTAVASYTKDKYDYGTRTLCYNPAPAVASQNCVTRTASGNQGTMNFVNLKPGTLYNYSIKAVDTKGGEKPYTTSGSFTTLGTTSIGAKPAILGAAPAKGGKSIFDLTGRNVSKPATLTLKVFRTSN